MRFVTKNRALLHSVCSLIPIYQCLFKVAIEQRTVNAIWCKKARSLGLSLS